MTDLKRNDTLKCFVWLRVNKIFMFWVVFFFGYVSIVTCAIFASETIKKLSHFKTLFQSEKRLYLSDKIYQIKVPLWFGHILMESQLK